MEEDKGTEYFRQLVVTISADLTELIKKWRAVAAAEPDISDDAQGQILSAVGQAELLMRQRFCQFSGLIDSCEFQTGEKKTLTSDLQGFWDMIYFQIEDVLQRFKLLEQLQNNNWKSEAAKNRLFFKKSRMSVSKPVAAPATCNTSVKAHIQAARKRLAEAKLRAKSKYSEDEYENKENKVFEAPGFFVIDSPVKKTSGKSEKGVTCFSQSSPVVSKKMPKPSTPNRNYIALSCITRSAKRALQEQNFSGDVN